MIINNGDLTWIWVCLSMEYIHVYPRNGRLNRKDDDEPVDLGMPYFQTNWNLWYTYQSLPQMGSQILAHKNHRCWVRFCAANHPILGSCRFLTCDETVREDAFPG